jgi:Gpi18-like mannosyltransferase
MKDVYKVLIIAILSRIIVFAVSIISNHLFTYVDSNFMVTQRINSFPFIGQFDRWDSEIYIGIALFGYPSGYPSVSNFPQYAHSLSIPTLAYSQWAFFPIYPMVMKYSAIVFTPFMSTTYSLMLSGFLISNVAFFVSVYFFYKLTQKLFKNQVALASTVFYVFCGGTIFMSSIFTEALFMAFMLGSFYFLEENKLHYAMILGIFASLTRADGFLICIPFAVAAILRFKENKKQSFILFLSSMIVASGYLWFNIVGYFQGGHVFPIQVIAHNVNWQVYPPITEQIYTLGESLTTSPISRPNVFQAFYIIWVILMCVPIAYFFVKNTTGIVGHDIKIILTLEKETLKYWLFYAAMLYVIFMFSNLYSSVRYAIPLLPIYWVYAKIYCAHRNYGAALLLLTIIFSIIGAYLLEISTPYFQ